MEALLNEGVDVFDNEEVERALSPKGLAIFDAVEYKGTLCELSTYSDCNKQLHALIKKRARRGFTGGIYDILFGPWKEDRLMNSIQKSSIKEKKGKYYRVQRAQEQKNDSKNGSIVSRNGSVTSPLRTGGLGLTSNSFGVETSPSRELPIKPIMGGIKQVGENYWEPWTGGKPRPDWVGLEAETLRMENPNWLRGSGPKARYAFNDRRDGLYKDDKDSRFDPDKDDLFDFCESLKEAFDNYGMDTIAYRADPAVLGRQEMVNTLTVYPRLNLEIMKAMTERIRYKFDTYDKDNDASAILFLKNSLKDDTRILLTTKCQNMNYTFGEVFMVFIEMIRPASSDLHESTVDKVINTKPQQFEGQNILKMTAFICPKIQDLVKARAWDSRKNVQLLRNLTEACAGIDNSEFKIPLFEMLTQAKKASAAITHLNNSEKEIHMANLKLSWQEILQKAEELYKEQTVEGNER